MSQIEIQLQDGRLHVRRDGLEASVMLSNVQIGHMGCKLIGSIENLKGKIPPELADKWDARFGSRARWLRNNNATKRLANAIQDAITKANLQGAVLWDTMRTGSDYWRPGKGLSKKVGNMDLYQNNISYAREDAFCPPPDLLQTFKDTKMSFGDYAEQYKEYLHAGDTLQLALFSCVCNLAQGRLPIFYCTDPYIPDYVPKAEMVSSVPYKQRHWLPELRYEGCHRIIFAEEVIKAFQSLGARVTLYELESAMEISHVRKW